MKSSGIIKSLMLFCVLAICAGAYSIQSSVSKSAEETLEKSLTITLNDTHAALSLWQAREKKIAKFWANDSRIVPAIDKLLDTSRQNKNLVSHASQAFLREHFRLIIETKKYQGYFIISPSGINLSSTRDNNIGVLSLLAAQKNILYKMFSGETVVSLPQRSDVQLPNENNNVTNEQPTMFVGAPIKNNSGEIIAALVFRINPKRDFTRIIERGRTGVSGETYAFDRESTLISTSRFNQELREFNIISAGQDSMLNVKVMNPTLNRSRRILTKTLMASSATAGQSGFNIKGYKDYRGVFVTGVWLWDSDMNMGLTSEIDLDEAYSSRNITVTSIYIGAILFIFLVIGLGIYILSLIKNKNS